MEYYEKYLIRYLTASEDLRKAAKKHWIKCHAENMKSGREDMIVFSAKMLTSITLADELQNHITVV